MEWMKTLRSRLNATEALVATGILLLAIASAIAMSAAYLGWKLPLVAFLSVLGVAATAGPLFRLWLEKERARDDEQPFSWTIPIAIVVALLVLALYRGADGSSLRRTVIELLLVAAAATVIGVLIGFLFGIPRVATKSSATGDEDTAAPNLETNTNLEAISDWLTKIIVGVGLVQAQDIAEQFDILLVNLDAHGLPRPLMGGTILFFLVAGFLNGYLWTRLILTRYFSMSERALRETPEYYEGLMNAYLYQPKPQGFRKVIRLFEQYTKRFGEPRHSRVWVYLASAYGQQYAWMRAVEGKTPGAPDLQPIVEKVVQAINSAVGSDSDALKLLQSLAVEGYDADLLMIANEEPQVRAALRLP